MNTSGLCGCGCGLPTPNATVTDRARNWVKGQPTWFIRGHVKRLPVTKSYRHIVENGRHTRIHVVRAERALGKPLPPKAVVHHADGSKRDDAPLVICQDQAYHHLLHQRMRVKAAGGNPNTEAICGHCRMLKPLAAFSGDRTRFNGLYGWCRDCNNEAQRQRRVRRLLAVAS
jgi:hypothetical protein